MSEELKKRTKAFALRIIRLTNSLPNHGAARHIASQLLRAGTSVAANYRAACRGRSPAEFISKMGIVEEEADECVFWMELLIEGGFVREDLIADLLDEASQILSITVASIRTTREGQKRKE